MKVSKYWRRALPVLGAAFLCTAAWAQSDTTPTTPTRPAYVDDILTKISELSTSVSTLSTNVDAISTSVAAIDTSVDAVSTSVAGVSSSVDTLSGDVDGISTDVDTLTVGVDGISTSVGTLSTSVETVDTTVDAISTSVAGVNTTVDALSGSVDDTGDDVDDVISKMNRLLRRMDDLETSIEDASVIRSIQRGTVSINSPHSGSTRVSSASGDATVTEVDPAKSILIVNTVIPRDDLVSVASMKIKSLTVWLVNGTTIRAHLTTERSGYMAIRASVRYQLIEFK